MSAYESRKEKNICIVENNVTIAASLPLLDPSKDDKLLSKNKK